MAGHNRLVASVKTAFVVIAIGLTPIFLLAQYHLIHHRCVEINTRKESTSVRPPILSSQLPDVTQSANHSYQRKTFKELDAHQTFLPDRDLSNFSLPNIYTKYPGKTVTMGCAITTKGVSSAEDMINDLAYFTHLLPSFCQTASPGYFYRFYMGFDFNDTILANPAGQVAFSKYFNSTITNECKGDFEVDVQFVQCNHSGKMAWAHNDALLAGYNDGMDYFYMVNDDTIMTSRNWTNIYVEQLAHFYPPNVGIVGPWHTGGNTRILTYFFAHRTHMDIFHFFFPRIFINYYADDWATIVYAPHNVKKMPNVLLNHTREKGVRYTPHTDPWLHMDEVLMETRMKLQHYLEARGVDWHKWNLIPTTPTAPTNQQRSLLQTEINKTNI